MRPKKTIDFKRGLKVLATEQGWLIETVSEKRGPTERIVVFYKEGHDATRICSFVLRQDQKEIDPGVARAIVENIRQLISDDTQAPLSLIDERRVVLVTWILNFFP